MTQDINTTAKQVGDELIDISASLDKRMDNWSSVSERPHGLSATECVGFINKETATSGLNLLIDVQAPANQEGTILRTWCIESRMGNDQIERFNNIQMDFAVDQSKARELAKKGGSVTRNDIRVLLHDDGTRLDRVIVSNKSGFDKTSQLPLGERYDLTAVELSGHEDTVSKVVSALHDALLTLKESASAEV